MGAPLVLLPGLMCDATIWRRQTAVLGDAIAIDGYGQAASIEAMAAHVLDHAPDRFALAGHSMGGRVALQVYAMAPGRVDRIALLDTGVGPVTDGERDKRFALRDIGRRDGIARLVAEWLPPMVHKASPADLAEMAAMCAAEGVARYDRQIAALLARPDAESVLPMIRCPALVATGREDSWSPPEHHEMIAAAIPQAVLEIFENCGHMSPVEAPDRVTAALNRLLDL